MKKIHCPQCAVVNLEKFVSFPYCAGCGVLLPQGKEAAAPLPFWRRPLGPMLWVTAVGCAAGGIVATTTAFTPASIDPDHIVIYGQTPHTVQVGHLLTIGLTVDTIENPTAPAQNLADVKLRLSGDWLRKFSLVSLTPHPDTVTLGGNGRYYHYRSLPRNAQLKLTVRAVQPGQHHLKAVIYAQQQYPGTFRTSINVLARSINRINKAHQ